MKYKNYLALTINHYRTSPLTKIITYNFIRVICYYYLGHWFDKHLITQTYNIKIYLNILVQPKQMLNLIKIIRQCMLAIYYLTKRL